MVSRAEPLAPVVFDALGYVVEATQVQLYPDVWVPFSLCAVHELQFQPCSPNIAKAVVARPLKQPIPFGVP